MQRNSFLSVDSRYKMCIYIAHNNNKKLWSELLKKKNFYLKIAFKIADDFLNVHVCVCVGARFSIHNFYTGILQNIKVLFAKFEVKRKCFGFSNAAHKINHSCVRVHGVLRKSAEKSCDKYVWTAIECITDTWYMNCEVNWVTLLCSHGIHPI